MISGFVRLCFGALLNSLDGLRQTAFAQMKQSVCADLKKVVVIWTARANVPVSDPSREVQHELLVLGVISLPHKSNRMIDDHDARWQQRRPKENRAKKPWYSYDGADNLSDLRSFVFVNRNYDGTTLVNPVRECFHQRFGIHKRNSASARARRQGPTVLSTAQGSAII